MIERPLAIARRDLFPVSRGHTLIIPRRHVASFFETTAEERREMLDLLDGAKAVVAREHRPDGYNIGINEWSYENAERAGALVWVRRKGQTDRLAPGWRRWFE